MKFLKKIKEKWNSMPLPVKASLVFFICSILQRGISVLTTPIFTRILTTEQYGYYSIFNSYLDIISVFTTLKLSGAVFVQGLVKFEDKKHKFISATAGLGTVITALFTCIYIPLREPINQLLGISTFVMFGLILASWATFIFELWSFKQKNEYKYKPLARLTMFTSIAKPVLGIIAVLATVEFKAEARIASLVSVEVFSYIWLFISFLKANKSFYDGKIWTYLLKLNIPLIPHYLTRTILNQSDTIMIRMLKGYSEAGIYNLSYMLAWTLTLVTNAILSTLNPWMYRKIKNKDFSKLGSISYIILLLVAGIGVAITAVAPEIVTIFAPEDYHDAIWIIPPLCMSVYFMFMYNLYANFEFYYEKTKVTGIISLTGGILNIVLNYFFIKQYGYIAAGYTTLVSYMYFTIAHYLVMKRIIAEKLKGCKIYNINIIVLISVAYAIFATIMMATYHLIVLRYSLLAILLVVILVNRKKLIKILKEIKSK